MEVIIVKYNAGNVQSVLHSLERLGVEATVTDDTAQIMTADKVIFPGVGEASTAMRYLKERKLDRVIKNLKQPVLGICLGMQLMCKHSEENNADCLGIFDLNVKKFASPMRRAGEGMRLKIPQIGWNNIYNLPSPLFEKINEQDYVYFVHSYFVEKSVQTIATANYGLEYSAAIHKDNFYAVQFHPEKSAAVGQRIIKNFIELI